MALEQPGTPPSRATTPPSRVTTPPPSGSLFVIKRRMHQELLATFAGRGGTGAAAASLFINYSARSPNDAERIESPPRIDQEHPGGGDLPAAVKAASSDPVPGRNPAVFKAGSTTGPEGQVWRDLATPDRSSEGILIGSEAAATMADMPPPKKAFEIRAVLSNLILQDLSQQYRHLPILEGFLEKLCPNQSMVKIWQRRFFFVDGDRLCYSREFIDVENRRRPPYSGRIINRIPFLLMLYISGESRDRQFFVEAHDARRSGKTRQYVLRTKSAQERDRWVDGIRLYAKHCRDVIQLGGMSSLPGSLPGPAPIQQSSTHLVLGGGGGGGPSRPETPDR